MKSCCIVRSEAKLAVSFSFVMHANVNIQNYFVEDTLWTGIPGDYTKKTAPEALAEVRKLVDDRKYSEATAAAVKLSGDPSDVCHVLPLFMRSNANFYLLDNPPTCI